ncbi:MAG: inositol monophosphatase [Rhodobiaceae bacterium]|nr:inositol monophosphatase [Rhodobiaceae bacterium]|tara:strand:- start:465 stop:1214 length:750 start_codon:yes stop_codon:yes gene_type:complete
MLIENLDHEIDLAITAIKEAGKLLLNNRDELNNEILISSKDVKLKADIESENLIKEIIAANSRYPILSEESGKSQEDLGETFWVIDPLDGTANYNRGIPISCISIGLVNKMEPAAGIILDFNNDELYVGNCSKNISTVNNKKITVSNIKEKKDAILITGLPHGTDYSNDALTEMITNMQSWKKVRMVGSAAIASCYVASGRADLYKENGVFFWDIVAGAAILNSAGGLAEISNFKDNYQVDVIFSNSKI